jgi:hypothetical protein
MGIKVAFLFEHWSLIIDHSKAQNPVKSPRKTTRTSAKSVWALLRKLKPDTGRRVVRAPNGPLPNELPFGESVS